VDGLFHQALSYPGDDRAKDEDRGADEIEDRDEDGLEHGTWTG